MLLLFNDRATPKICSLSLLGAVQICAAAGKSMKRLSLLSGGEKSVTAIAFLFAVFLARPCPFYNLDEVEAALDDVNIEDRKSTRLNSSHAISRMPSSA